VGRLVNEFGEPSDLQKDLLQIDIATFAHQ
jgi:hypothetical protein